MAIDTGDYIQVTSSNINAIAYDKEESKLYVRFMGKNGATSLYSYDGVEEDVFNDMVDSESKGRFLQASIKGNYEFTKVE